MPLSDSSESILIDIFGTSRTIDIEGTIVGDVSTLRTFIENIETIQNGQQSGSTFVSSWTNSNKTVVIQDFSHTKTSAGESHLDYRLTLVQGDVI